MDRDLTLTITWEPDGCHAYQGADGGGYDETLVCDRELTRYDDEPVRHADSIPTEGAIVVARRETMEPGLCESLLGLDFADVIEGITGMWPTDFEVEALADECDRALARARHRSGERALLAERWEWPAEARDRLAALAMPRLSYDIGGIEPEVRAFASHIGRVSPQSTTRVDLDTSGGPVRLELWASTVDMPDGAFEAYATYVDPDTGQVPERAFSPTGETTARREMTFASEGARGLARDLLAACGLASRGFFVPSADLSPERLGRARDASRVAR